MAQCDFDSVFKAKIGLSSEDKQNMENRIYNNAISQLKDGSPKVVDTTSNILALQQNKGIAVSTDNGNWFYWDGSKYADSGRLYQSTGIDAENPVIKSKLDEYQDIVVLTEYEDGRFNTIGEDVDNGTGKFIRTPFIDIKGYDKLLIDTKAKNSQGTYFPILFFKKPLINSQISGYHDILKGSNIYDVPKDANYVRVFNVKDGEYIKVKGNILNKINENKELLQNYIQGSNNLFDSSFAKNNYAVSTAGGGILIPKENRWVTGLIKLPNNNIKKLFVSLDSANYVSYYDINGQYLSSSGSSKTRLNPISIIPDASYIILTYDSITTPFSYAKTLFVGEITNSNVYEPKEVINPYKLGIKEVGFFNKETLKEFASSVDEEKGYLTFNKSFNFNVQKCNKSFMNQIVECRAKYIGNEAPTIQFAYTNRIEDTIDLTDRDYWLYESTKYTMCNNRTFDTKSWRVPPFDKISMNLTVIINIPQGTELIIDTINNRYDNNFNRFSNGIRLNAHLGYMCPKETYSSLEMASKLGFESCIVVPKVTKDGRYVCFHDDGGIGTKFTTEDGSYLTEAEQAKRISDYTLSELDQWFIGQSIQYKFHNVYDGEKIVLLEDFFKLCAKTGMHPMFSIHPILPEQDWINIREMALKYNVLKDLTLKTSANTATFELLHRVFGDEIEGYEADCVADETQWALENMNFNVKNKVIEYFFENITPEKIKNALNAGFRVSCFVSTPKDAIDSKNYKYLIDLGVSEFTEDFNCSSGLKW